MKNLADNRRLILACCAVLGFEGAVRLDRDLAPEVAQIAGHAALPHKSGRKSASFKRPRDAAAIFFASSGEGLR